MLSPFSLTLSLYLNLKNQRQRITFSHKFHSLPKFPLHVYNLTRSPYVHISRWQEIYQHVSLGLFQESGGNFHELIEEVEKRIWINTVLMRIRDSIYCVWTNCTITLGRRLSKLEMLKRRGKGPPKKGQGRRAAKRNKQREIILLKCCGTTASSTTTSRTS